MADAQRVGKKGMIRRRFGPTVNPMTGRRGQPVEVPANGRRFEDGTRRSPFPAPTGRREGSGKLGHVAMPTPPDRASQLQLEAARRTVQKFGRKRPLGASTGFPRPYRRGGR